MNVEPYPPLGPLFTVRELDTSGQWVFIAVQRCFGYPRVMIVVSIPKDGGAG